MTLIPAAETLLADIETTAIEYDDGGVIIYPKTVHCMVARDYEREETHIFGGPNRPSIAEGVDYLERSKRVVFHNGRGFDEPVLTLTHNLDTTKSEFLDSLILCQLFYSNVKEDEDFARFEKHKMRPDGAYKFTGDLVGKHALEAWGLRLEDPRPKTDYAGRAKDAGIEDIWGAWNQIMEDYCVQDVMVLEGLWHERLKDRVTPHMMQAIRVEHYLAELMNQVKSSGIKFDKPKALKLVDELKEFSTKLEERIQHEFPPRYEPMKWKYHPIPIGEPSLTAEERNELDTLRKSNHPSDKRRVEELLTTNGPTQMLTPLMWEHESKDVYRPRFNLPQGYLREWWGVPNEPKVNRKFYDKQKNFLYESVPGCPFTKIELTPLNPSSRIQISRRLLELGWIPEEFTESGAPSLSEVELLKIDEEFPVASSIANYLLVQKRLGAVESGEKAWLKLIDSSDFIHPTIRPCATVTFRGTHADPNISQVPSVRAVKVLDETGNPVLNDKGKEKMRPGVGFEGKWGWDCRELFTVPEGFTMVGSDLAGIEMRCWAHYLWKYDDGRFADIILNKDVHEENRVILGFNDRRKAKEFLYALMYGAGDEKLGFIIEPTATVERQKMTGRAARVRFMGGLIGYEALNDELMLGVRRGYLKGLDGRRCPVRKQHAALNTLLQSAGAIISKYWIIFALQLIEQDYKLEWGYDKDFTLMIYSHDELDFAARPEHVDKIKHACQEGARMTRDHLKFRLPIDVGVIDGPTWAHVH